MILVIGGMAQGKHDFAKSNFPNKKIIDLEIPGGIENIPEDERDVVVVTTEVGCGIVPIDRGDRDFREDMGRAQVVAAKASSEVYRVVAGIGQRIK